MRCFVALDVAPAVRAAIATVQDHLRAAAPDVPVRWTPTESIHLTLAFLGDIAPATAAALGERLLAVAAVHRPITLAVRGVGAFPTLRRPSVVWVGLAGEGIDPLRACALAVHSLAGGLEIALDGKRFAPHLTIGRLRDPRRPGTLPDALARCAADAGTWTAPELVLYRSHLHPTGSTYETLARTPFRAVA